MILKLGVGATFIQFTYCKTLKMSTLVVTRASGLCFQFTMHLGTLGKLLSPGLNFSKKTKIDLKICDSALRYIESSGHFPTSLTAPNAQPLISSGFLALQAILNV